ncbi:RNA polymerase sigma factor, sigma-70 family [Caulobacter sp. AP07]|uniref:RNA polymerase sigma factor n=1 Tax=Caulobacter sp. AP07 TaxID=1144304 RepID=UPI000271E330|nr:RNA polymerase sigma factor [Caulobacter sp. AP07]EJL38461.1 RNA polymerase sigma factor, sigma-70 family [Caulobacter sp. AP07]
MRRTGERRTAPDLPGLLEAHYDDLRRFAFRKARSASLADDVMQDAWIKLSDLMRSPGFDGATVINPISYLRRLIANLVIDRQRQAAAQTRRVSTGDLPLDARSETPSAFQVLAGRQEMAIVQAAIAELPDKCRAVILLYRGQDLTMQQVADRLGISSRTVENHLARAMTHCRRRLRDARGDG